MRPFAQPQSETAGREQRHRWDRREGTGPHLCQLMKLPEGGFSPAPADLGLPFKRLLEGRFGFAAQAKQIWGLTLVTGGAHSIFCTRGRNFFGW